MLLEIGCTLIRIGSYLDQDSILELIMNQLNSQTVSSLQLDHLGIVAGLLKDANIRYCK